jgi:hypothetical protein
MNAGAMNKLSGMEWTRIDAICNEDIDTSCSVRFEG